MRLGPAKALCMVGVPRRSESNSMRRWLWVLLFVAVFMFSQLWFLLVMQGSWILVGVVLLGIVGGGVAMVTTGRGRSRATERLVMTWGGIGRKEWGKSAAPSELMDWPEQIDVRVESIGAVWQRIKVFSIETNGARKKFFDCGFRCEREQLGWVKAAIEALHRGEDAPDPEPVMDVSQSSIPWD